ncbi:hypothetical protein LTR95_007912, partial [Oleoguttula sp. CCFEE 5521]
RNTLERVQAEAETNGWPKCGAKRPFNELAKIEQPERDRTMSSCKISFSSIVSLVDIDGTEQRIDVGSISIPCSVLKAALRDDLPTPDPRTTSHMRIPRGTWHMYQEWLYQGTLEPLLGTACYFDDMWCRCLPIVDLYLAGEYMQDNKFCNAVMDFFIARHVKVGKGKPCTRVIRDIWQGTAPDCMLRKVVVALGAGYYDSVEHPDKQWVKGLPAGYALEMHLLRWREPFTKITASSAEWRCQFHRHSPGTPSCGDDLLCSLA